MIYYSLKCYEIASMDVISPWLVGRFNTNADFDHLFESVIAKDSAFTAERCQDYAPNVWPGFSWYNLQHGATALNQIPRNAGAFWQYQFDAFTTTTSHMISAQNMELSTPADARANTDSNNTAIPTIAGKKRSTLKMPYPPLFVYGAMFDEFDESTAMAKAAASEADLPAEGKFLHLSIDGVDLPSDFYLQLAGDNTKQYQQKMKMGSSDGAVAHLSEERNNAVGNAHSSMEEIISSNDELFLVQNKEQAKKMSVLQRDHKLLNSKIIYTSS